MFFLAKRKITLDCCINIINAIIKVISLKSQLPDQKHFLWTKLAPPSKYSCLLINIGWKFDNDARIEPPIHDENFLSGGSYTFIFIVDGAKAITSFWSLSFKFFSIDVPPAITMFPYKSFLMSESHFNIDWKVNSCAPKSYFPTILLGWKRASGHLKAWLS